MLSFSPSVRLFFKLQFLQFRILLEYRVDFIFSLIGMILNQVVMVSLLFIIFHNMIPSTKEMATIYVIPKIANSTFVNETLPAEMKDIYGMAKDWMKTTLKTDEPKPIPAAEKHECKNCGKEHK